MQNNRVLCVISHTHWDREWYMPLEVMRLRLVDLIDRCLELLEAEPTYVFHLDAQTVVLEDYLTIRTDRRHVLERYIRDGRLCVGPWYLQNDYYLTSGEATVRNLLEGTRLAASFGGCGQVGYAPDQFGNISQLPQILHGFGMDNFVFGRGACKVCRHEDGTWEQKPFPSEFIWEGADGSRVLAIHMTYWYNNAQRFSADIEKAQALTETIVKQFEGLAATPYLLLMNGVDHLEAQDDLLPVLRRLRDKGWNIRQTRMDEYVQWVSDYIRKNDVSLEVHSGEFRSGPDLSLLKGTLSSRIYLKQWNVLMQNRLEQQLEPLYAMLAVKAGDTVYPTQHFRYMWKELMKNHPHDSICGCSRDEVHKHMEDNFERLDEMSADILRQGMALAAAHIPLVDNSPDNYGVLVANTLPYTRSQVVRVVVDLPVSEQFSGFELLDPTGRLVSFRVEEHKKALRDVFSPINLPGVLSVERFVITFLAEEVPGLSFRAYTIKGTAKPLAVAQSAFSEMSAATIENVFLKVSVSSDGRVDIVRKADGCRFADCLEWEDTADRGDSYVYMGGEEAAIYGSAFPATIILQDEGATRQSIHIRRVLRLPAYYDTEKKCRSEALVDCPVTLTVSLEENARVVTLFYAVENRAQDHRLRLLVNTGIDTAASAADIPFDVVRHTDADQHPNTCDKSLPNTSFAALERADGGVAVLTTGQHAYEHMGSTLAFTVLRATGVINRDYSTYRPWGGEQWYCPANQCQRTLTGRMGLYPYSGVLLQTVPQAAVEFRTPMAVHFFAADLKKFSGGRPAVQDSAIAEQFYMPDPFPNLQLASDQPVIDLKHDPEVVLTAFKLADNRGGCVLRFLNLDDIPHAVEVTTSADMTRIPLSEQTDLNVCAGSLVLNKKELCTIRIKDGGC